MSIKEKILVFKENLELFDDELDKYEYLIDLGKKLENLESKDKIPKNLVHGCTSQVWLIAYKKDNKLFFKGTSDALIVKGLISMLLEIFSNEEVKSLQEIDMDILHELNLSEIITPNRQSGVIGMIKKIKKYAKELEDS